MAEYIERTELIADMDQAILDIPSSETVDSLTIYAVLRDCVCEAPAADVDPVRHGWWECVTNVSKTRGWYSCSRCGSSPPYKASGIMDAEATYCPNCGAKMDGEEGAGDEA